jgi:hypothetical protein
MGDVIEAMLKQAMTALLSDGEKVTLVLEGGPEDRESDHRPGGPRRRQRAGAWSDAKVILEDQDSDPRRLRRIHERGPSSPPISSLSLLRLVRCL